MDLSKLPRLSNADNPPSPQPSPPPIPAVAVERTSAQPGSQQSVPDVRNQGFAPELLLTVFIGLFVGLFMLTMGMNFGHFAKAKLTGQVYHTAVNWTDGTLAGSEVAYFDLQGFTALTEMGMFLFGLILLYDAFAMAAILLRPSFISRLFLGFATALTALGTILNLYICGKLMGNGMIPQFSALVVLIGAWMIFDQWRTLQTAGR